MTTRSRRLRCRCIHSIWSANTFGVATSTVAGRLRIHRWRVAGFRDVDDALADLERKSSSVIVNVSGEYSKRQSVSGCSARIA